MTTRLNPQKTESEKMKDKALKDAMEADLERIHRYSSRPTIGEAPDEDSALVTAAMIAAIIGALGILYTIIKLIF